MADNPALIPFEEFLPDQSALANAGMPLIKNAIPGAQGYQSFQDLAVLTGALSYYARGTLICKDSDLSPYAFAADDGSYSAGEARLYHLQSDYTWKNVSTLSASASGTSSVSTFYTLSTGEGWEFQQMGNVVTVAGWGNNIQQFTLGTSTRFASADSSAPQARHLGQARNFLFAGNTYDGTDGNKPWRVWWIFNDPTGVWTPSLATQAGRRDFNSGAGEVQRVIGVRGTPVVIQEKQISVGFLAGNPKIWDFDEVEGTIGTPCPRSCVLWRNAIVYISYDGFNVFTPGSGSVPIGKDRVDNFFWNNVDKDFLHNVQGELHPVLPLVMWIWPDNDATNGRPNRVLVWNWKQDKFGLLDLEIECLGSILSSATSLEDLDSIYSSIEAVPISLDSRLFAGGQESFIGFNPAHQAGEFAGSYLTAQLTSKKVQPVPGKRAFVTNMRPVVDNQDGSSITCRLGYAETLQEDITYLGFESQQNAVGDCPVEMSGRFFQFRTTLAGQFDHALGIEIEAHDDGDA